MNKTAVALLAGAVGAAFGGLTVYYTLRARVYREVAEMRQYYREAREADLHDLKAHKDSVTKQEARLREEQAIRNAESAAQYESIVEGLRYSAESQVDYTTPEKHEVPDELFAETEEDEELDDIPDEVVTIERVGDILVESRSSGGRSNRPYIISEEEYEHSDENFEHIEVHYYPDTQSDVKLCDDRGFEMDTELLGSLNLREAFERDRVDILYVRNRRLMIDFDIIRHEGDPSGSPYD